MGSIPTLATRQRACEYLVIKIKIKMKRLHPCNHPSIQKVGLLIPTIKINKSLTWEKNWKIGIDIL